VGASNGRADAARRRNPRWSQAPAVVGPVQERLPLSAAAGEVAPAAGAAELRNVPAHRLPAPDLALVVGMAPAEPVAAVPLEPACGAGF
jgi:hypothetical protein